MPIRNMKTAKRSDRWRILIYAKPGTGKTSEVKYLQGKTLVLSLDESEKVLAGLDVDVWKFDRLTPTPSISQFVKELNNGDFKDYDNIVIDNVSSFEKDWFIEQGRHSKSGIRNELQDYSGWTNFFIRVMTAIYAAPQNIFVTAWEKQVSVTTETGQQFMQYQPSIRDSVRDTLMGLTDIVGRMVAKSDGERGFILEGDDAMFAKNRLDNRKGCKAEDLFKFGDDN